MTISQDNALFLLEKTSLNIQNLSFYHFSVKEAFNILNLRKQKKSSITVVNYEHRDRKAWQYSHIF